MLLMGIWINLTKKPMKPIIANPIAVAIAIFWNSFRSGFVHLLTRRMESLINCFPGSTKDTIWSMTYNVWAGNWRQMSTLTSRDDLNADSLRWRNGSLEWFWWRWRWQQEETNTVSISWRQRFSGSVCFASGFLWDKPCLLFIHRWLMGHVFGLWQEVRTNYLAINVICLRA